MRTIINPSGAPGPFSPAIATDDAFYVSGQGGLVAGAVVPGGIEAETTQALTNIETLLEAAGSSIDEVVAITCYLVDIGEWGRMNVAWSTFFEGRSVPTRTAIGVAGLPLGMRVEMTATAVRSGAPQNE